MTVATRRARGIRATVHTIVVTLVGSGVGVAGAASQVFDPPSARVSLDPDRWTSHADTVARGELWGREALYVGRGAAFAEGIEFENGVIELEMAAPDGTEFMGLAFRVQSEDAYEMFFFRPSSSGTTEAIQYQPSLMGSGTWQLFHGPANGTADFARDRWVPIRVVVQGPQASLFVDGADTPALVIPDLALGTGSGTLGVWTGSFGSGTYVSNLRFTPDETAFEPIARPSMPEGTLIDWELSPAFDGAEAPLGWIPDLDALDLEPVSAEPWPLRPAGAPGIVWVNRYRRSPDIGTSTATLEGGVPGTRVVFARTTIRAEESQVRRLHFGYTDNLEIFLNGQPLFVGMNPLGMRTLRGVMEMQGEAVYLPLQAGDNELVFAVTEFFGGWGYWGRLEATAPRAPS